jgi:hypothetical protein
LQFEIASFALFWMPPVWELKEPGLLKPFQIFCTPISAQILKPKSPQYRLAVPKMEPAARNDLQAPLSHLFRQDY